MNELRKIVREKLEELTLAEYEGNVEGLLIISIYKGNFIIHPAYDSTQNGIMNVALDIAKTRLLDNLNSNMTEVKRNG